MVIVTPHLGNGGAERVLSLLMTEWVKMGIRVWLVQTNANRYGNNYQFSKDIEIINLPKRNGLFRRFKQVVDLRKFLLKHPSAVVLSFVNTTIW